MDYEKNLKELLEQVEALKKRIAQLESRLEQVDHYNARQLRVQATINKRPRGR
jgi:predicted nuclease with TOPRIM domain